MQQNQGKLWKLKYVMAVVWAGYVVAWLFAFSKIETIVISGPILVLMALIALKMSIAVKVPEFRWIAIGQLVLPIIIFLIINIWDIRPDPARKPVLLSGACFILLTGLLMYHFRSLPDPSEERWRCEKCQYALIGLVEPRCPECGTPFNAEIVSEALKAAGIVSPLPPKSTP